MRRISTLLTVTLALILVAAGPALAQSIDLSPIQSLLQGIVDALTGPLGVVIATLAVLGVFLSWFFNIIDLRQALFRLTDVGAVRFDQVDLVLEFLLLLDALAALVAGHQAAGVAVARELGESLILLPVVRQRFDEPRLDLFG